MQIITFRVCLNQTKRFHRNSQKLKIKILFWLDKLHITYFYSFTQSIDLYAFNFELLYPSQQRSVNVLIVQILEDYCRNLTLSEFQCKNIWAFEHVAINYVFLLRIWIRKLDFKPTFKEINKMLNLNFFLNFSLISRLSEGSFISL